MRCIIRSTRFSKVLLLWAMTMALGGCAPEMLRDGVPWMTARYKVTDAKSQRVETWPCMRFDPALAADLESVMQEENLDTARYRAREVLACAYSLSLQSTRNELDRLPDEGWWDLNELYFQNDSPPDAAQREKIWRRFLEQVESRYGQLYAQVREAKSLDELHGYLAEVQHQIQPAVATTGHALRALPWALFSIPSALAVASIHANEYQGELDRPFEAAIRYEPVLGMGGYRPDQPLPLHWDLLRKYAPVIIQEQAASPTYRASIDSIGGVVALDDEFIQIDPNEPTIYVYARDVLIQDESHVQLVYTFWFSEHPPMKDTDPEAGPIEGLVLRITLDQDHMPVIYETVYACGCYHRTYPTETLERAARQEFGDPEEDKRFAIEHDARGKFDLILPKLVRDAGTSARPVIRCAAGHHAILDICNSDEQKDSEVRNLMAYEIQDYEVLERLPLSDGRFTSMFYDNGLVKGAQRLEGVFFTPIGILSAGQPRQRGTQMIHWDHWLLDDPKLFEKALRLPKAF